MKNKRLLIILAIVVVIAVITILVLTLFSVRHVNFVFYGNDGNKIATPEDAPGVQEVTKLFGGKSILLLSTKQVLETFNELYPEFHALGVVRHFPNYITLHIVRRIPVLSVTVGSQTIYLDAFGYVVADKPDYQTLDITNTFVTALSNATYEVGNKLHFESAVDNQRLDIVLQTVTAVWQLYYDYSDIAVVVREISFNDVTTTMIITTKVGALIKVEKPTDNLNSRLINAFSVYFNQSEDLQKPGVIITVSSQGNISTQQS